MLEFLTMASHPARPRNNILAQLGDSRLAQGGSGYVGNERGVERGPVQRMVGIQFWLELISGGVVRCPPTMNFGLSGDTTEPAVVKYMTAPGTRSRVDAVIATGAGSCLLLAGTNDLWPAANLSAERTIANLDAMICALVAAGMWVVIVAETPRSILSKSESEHHATVRRWILSEAGREQVVVVDVWDALLERGSDRLIDSRYSPDKLHLNHLGSRLVAEHIWAATRGLFGLDAPVSDRPPIDVGPFTVSWESVPAGCLLEVDDRREAFRLTGTPTNDRPILEVCARIDHMPFGENGRIGGKLQLEVEKALNVPNICTSIVVRTDQTALQRSTTGDNRENMPDWLPEGGLRGTMVVPTMQIAGRARGAMFCISSELRGGSPVDLLLRLSAAEAWIGEPGFGAG